MDANFVDATWQPLVDAELDVKGSSHLRMSAAGHCPAALAYATMGLTASDPPDEQSRNRMAMGHFLEILIIRALKARGWETRYTVVDEGQLELDLTIKSGESVETITGHPDGICRHPEHTKGYWVLLECKSMSVDRALEVEEYGVADIYPGYIVQAALYGHRLFEMGLISHPQRAIFGMIDREGRVLSPERVKWDDDVFPSIIDKLEMVVSNVAVNSRFTPPYPQDSQECRYCDYHSLCWGEPKPYGGRNGQPPKVKIGMQDSAVVYEAARKWRELKPQIDAARDVLREASDRHDGATIEAAGVLAGVFAPRELPAYDTKKLEELVPLDILRECLSKNQPPKRPPFWVRNIRR